MRNARHHLLNTCSVLVAVFMLFLAFGAEAQTKKLNSQINKSTTARPQESKKIFSTSVETSQVRSLVDQKDGSTTDEKSVSMSFGVQWTDSLSTKFAIDYLQSKSNGFTDQADFSDLSAGTSFGQKSLGSYFNWSPSLSVVVPTSKKSRVGAGLYAATGAVITLSIKKELLTEGLSLSSSLGVSRSFHQYETSLSGRNNNQWGTTQRLDVSYKYKDVSVYAKLIRRLAFSYQGGQSEVFEHEEGLSYEFIPNYTMTIGHTLGGSAYKSNGTDSNYAFLNENDSTIFASLGASF